MNQSPTMARVFRKETYLRLAAAMNSSKPTRELIGADDWENREYTQWVLDCTALADMLADQSQAFDREQFLKNCGV